MSRSLNTGTLADAIETVANRAVDTRGSGFNLLYRSEDGAREVTVTLIGEVAWLAFWIKRIKRTERTEEHWDEYCLPQGFERSVDAAIRLNAHLDGMI